MDRRLVQPVWNQWNQPVCFVPDKILACTGSFRPYWSIYRISAEILVLDRNRKNSSFKSETISDLPACCAHVTASIIRTFLLLFLQPISRICSSTFSSFFVHPVPLISYYFLYVFFNLPLQFPFVIKLFRFMCFNHNHTRRGGATCEGGGGQNFWNFFFTI